MAESELDEVIAEAMQDPLFALHFRIRELHAPDRSGHCVVCRHGTGGRKAWPCPTIKILEAS